MTAAGGLWTKRTFDIFLSSFSPQSCHNSTDALLSFSIHGLLLELLYA